VEPFASDPEDIVERIDFYYRRGLTLDDEIDKAINAAMGGGMDHDGKNSPTSGLIDLIISKGLRKSATDVHFAPEYKSLRVSYRVDGILQSDTILPIALHTPIVTRLKILSNMNIAEQRLPQEGSMSIDFLGRSIDIRTASSPGVKGEAIALRILDKGNVALGLGHLGLNPEEEAVIQRLSKLPHGMVLMAGPTGSGKTTTLYSILKGINALEKNILTIEDPVEYELPMIKQTQLNDQAGFTFEVAIRHFLRQDPDILLIGEIRDLVTAKTAFQAAMTGHLVFSTIHTNSAASTVARLLDLGVENYFIPSTVRAIVAQRLIRRLCTKCREQYTPEQAELKEYGLQNGWNPAGKPIFKPTGCEMCGYTGYLGRTGIFEIFNVSPSISKGISDKAPADELERIAIKEGMKTLRDSGLEKAIKGETSLEEVIRVTV
jgi:type II secretory ATPase GspE/PulE/Tfp pilus assembly ATPase PilB-like protein